MRADGVILKMLVWRYFVYVGGALLGLLLVCNAVLPKLPSAESTVAADAPVIRIHSERKWPERIVLDTNAPMPVTVAKADNAAGQDAALAQTPSKAGVQEALAQLPPAAPKTAAADTKRPVQKVPPRRRVARARFVPRQYMPMPMMVAQQPRFGFVTW